MRFEFLSKQVFYVHGIHINNELCDIEEKYLGRINAILGKNEIFQNQSDFLRKKEKALSDFLIEGMIRISNLCAENEQRLKLMDGVEAEIF
jgi:hypothetical protein